jgi:hypothetical protein
MSRAAGCPNPTPAFLPHTTLGAKRGFLIHGLGGDYKTVDAVSEVLRFEPHSGWAALPVQPPAGIWQIRLASVYPVFVANIVFFCASGGGYSGGLDDSR